ncbi:hypothetical protein EUGRSUZ_E00440 [Eucalyptus grandis]|uniref:Uncharacterized protein n=2 Tax=Eucalyptus grandis TaxID=71139 RepID=A0ACC3KRL0_EUCGR|nr:hypothetical protein EUGRSUZ_E00440 [Eucalyptus grandis]
MLPSKLLLCKHRFIIPVMLPMVEGMCPVNLFLPKFRYCKFDSLPIDIGMLPVSMLPFIYNRCRLKRFTIASGILPRILFVDNCSLSSWVEKLPTETGSLPLNRLCCKSSISRLLQLVKSARKLRLFGSRRPVSLLILPENRPRVKLMVLRDDKL